MALPRRPALRHGAAPPLCQAPCSPRAVPASGPRSAGERGCHKRGGADTTLPAPQHRAGGARPYGNCSPLLLLSPLQTPGGSPQINYIAQGSTRSQCRAGWAAMAARCIVVRAVRYPCPPPPEAPCPGGHWLVLGVNKTKKCIL